MKYIIDIEDTPVDGLYRAKAFKTLVFDQYGLDRLERVPEESDNAESYFDVGYQTGVRNAWNFARKLVIYNGLNGEIGDLFWERFDGMTPNDIIMDKTYDDAREIVKLIEEEAAQICEEENIRNNLSVGDEVTAEGGAARFVVTSIRNDISGIDFDGGTYSYLPEEIDGKTGMHYDIVGMLNRVRLTDHA